MKKVKGFTLVELIVVIAILSVLAAIITPQFIEYANRGRISKLNTNARHVYGAAAYAAADCVAGTSTGVILSNTVYTGSDVDRIAYSATGGVQFSLTNYLSDDFTGYFALMTDSSGSGCTYALWSSAPIAPGDVVQLSMHDVETSMGVSGIGCYPLADDP